MQDSCAEGSGFKIAGATLSSNSRRQTVYTHCTSVHQAAKLVAALLSGAGSVSVFVFLVGFSKVGIGFGIGFFKISRYRFRFFRKNLPLLIE